MQKDTTQVMIYSQIWFQKFRIGGKVNARYRVFFNTGPPPKISKYRKVNLG